jgi:hypothetical protein
MKPRRLRWRWFRQALAPVVGWEVVAYLVVRTMAIGEGDVVCSPETLASLLETSPAAASDLLRTLIASS